MAQENTIVVILDGSRVVDVWAKDACRVLVLNTEIPVNEETQQLELFGQNYFVSDIRVGRVRDYRLPQRPKTIEYIEAALATCVNAQVAEERLA